MLFPLTDGTLKNGPFLQSFRCARKFYPRNINYMSPVKFPHAPRPWRKNLIFQGSLISAPWNVAKRFSKEILILSPTISDAASAHFSGLFPFDYHRSLRSTFPATTTALENTKNVPIFHPNNKRQQSSLLSGDNESRLIFSVH
jgi:hypothetical protein